MINSFGTGKPTEADGSGRGTGKRTEAAAAVRAVRLFGLFGCSGCSAVRAVRAAAALLPRMASGERSEAPTAAGASSSRIQQLSFSCAVVFAAVAFGNSGEGKIHRCDGCVGGCAGRRLSSPAWPAASVAKPPPAEKGFISLFILCPLHYLLLVCR